MNYLSVKLKPEKPLSRKGDARRTEVSFEAPGRIVIEGVAPEIEKGRFPIKRVIGEKVKVEANIFCAGHDALDAALLYKKEELAHWTEAPMRFLVNDRWQGEFFVTELGRYHYTLRAWMDRFRSWRQGLEKKLEAKEDLTVDLLIGAELVEKVVRRASGDDAKKLKAFADVLRRKGKGDQAIRTALDETLLQLVKRYPDEAWAVTYEKELVVVVDREKARFGAWYEVFPHSCGESPGAYGSFKGCEARLPYIAEMGFDVLYLAPIHPIGQTHRKGKNNSTISTPEDPGSPWAIGSEEGGHKTIHPKLGTLEDFRRLIKRAKEFGLEMAMDIAFHCSLDHPYIKEHPDWFIWRPDGMIQYAENPPKKYQDIYPINFDTQDWKALWEEMRSIIRFWIDQGIRIFRVDNPHTKPFAFWEWLINGIKRIYPDVIFLSEAFTRPKVMIHLAKLGFTQSYTYFAWRNTKWELTEYLTEITQTEVREFFRPNFWPNTPDILTEYIQTGGRAACMVRFVLAATLSSNYGIYGPAFELCEHQAIAPGKEEYLGAEKYEVKIWDLNRPDSLKGLIAKVNRIRKENPALQRTWNIRFHETDNEQLICYSKVTDDFSNRVLVIVNLDTRYQQSGWVNLSLDQLGVDPSRPFVVEDLLNDRRYTWQGSRNFVALEPGATFAHVFRVVPQEKKG